MSWPLADSELAYYPGLQQATDVAHGQHHGLIGWLARA
jgi:hypothetical protein